MLVTLVGMGMEERAEQPSNADAPTLVTLFGKVTEAIDVHS
jgi:hypothetical protein